MSKTLQKIRHDACGRIKAAMVKHGITDLAASNFGRRRLIIESGGPDAGNRVLDTIVLSDTGLSFEASDDILSFEYSEENIPTDALIAIMDLVDEHFGQ